jgi:hypothetical protein
LRKMASPHCGFGERAYECGAPADRNQNGLTVARITIVIISKVGISLATR